MIRGFGSELEVMGGLRNEKEDIGECRRSWGMAWVNIHQKSVLSSKKRRKFGGMSENAYLCGSYYTFIHIYPNTMYTFLLILAVLPSILLFLYIYVKDPIPEPFRLLFKAFVYGMVSCIPIILVESFLMPMVSVLGENVIGTTVNAFFGAALPEEGFKLLALWLILRKNPYYDEHYDGIVYSVCVGLGFATVENILYVIGSSDVMVALSRAFLAVPCHYACAVLMGYFYSVYHFIDNSNRVKWSVLLAPVIAHGIYDSIAFLASLLPAISGIIMIVLCFFCIKLHKYCKKHIDKHLANDSGRRQEEDWEESQFT